jgi:hypothetical protein
MNKKIHALILGAALGTAAIAPAQADVVTFDDVSQDLFAVGQSFTSDGFRFTTALAGFGAVTDSASFVFGNAPTNANSQFYAGLSDAGVTMATVSTRAFYVDEFEFSFIPAVPGAFPPGDSPGRLLARYVTWGGISGEEAFDFSSADANGLFAFSIGKAGAGGLNQGLWSVTFLACLYDANGACVNPAGNEAQFALDNIYARVPEPGSLGLALLGLGMMAGVARRRRSN